MSKIMDEFDAWAKTELPRLILNRSESGLIYTSNVTQMVFIAFVAGRVWRFKQSLGNV